MNRYLTHGRPQRRAVRIQDPHAPVDRGLVGRLLRSAVRQWAAYLEIQTAIEDALGVDDTCDVREYIEKLAPEFIDHPDWVGGAQVEELAGLCGARA